MGAPSYQLRTVWRTTGTIAEAMAVLDDVDALPRWWPSVYLRVRRLADGDPDGVGRRTELRTTGWLPYSLSWISTLTEPVTERGFAFTAEGDFTGDGRWFFRQNGPHVVLAFDWRISVTKPVVRRFSWLFRPLFAANHRWAMSRGLQSLRLELASRRAGVQPDGLAAERPGPTFRLLRRR